jgi:hypothetical protein
MLGSTLGLIGGAAAVLVLGYWLFNSAQGRAALQDGEG